MATVSFQNIEKSFGGTKVIHGISFDIHCSEFVVPVGNPGDRVGLAVDSGKVHLFDQTMGARLAA